MKTKLIAQFVCKSRDEFFKSSYSIIRQCLLNKNKNTTVSKFKNILNLHMAIVISHSQFHIELRQETDREGELPDDPRDAMAAASKDSKQCNAILFRRIYALFSSKNFCKIGIVALSFVFDKYCPIMN